MNKLFNITEEEKNRIRGLHNIKEEDFVSGRGYDSDYAPEKELSPTQQSVNDEVMTYIGQTFASWMSPDNPPFSQEYSKGPYWEKLSSGIKNIVINKVE